MSYKKKVEKALELIGEEDKPYCVVIDLVLPVRLVHHINLEDKGVVINEGKYFTTRLEMENNVLSVIYHDYSNIVTSCQTVVLELPHIKTLEQFEQLYLSLTGKELEG